VHPQSHRQPLSARDDASLSAVVIAGTHSGVGKTSITLGLIGALRNRGLRVQPFKVGPDFIDPLHHSHASGRAGLNLDGWMLTPGANRQRFARFTADADVAVIEGVMGVFDGSDAKSDRGSTAEMAKLLGLPVVLVIDASAMARSAAALIHGFVSFDADLRVAGVILNNVGGQVHADMVRDAVDGAVPILGALERDAELVMPERHLGLHLPHEARVDYVGRLASLIETHVDLDQLLSRNTIERSAPGEPPPSLASEPTVRIGVARDEAFCFYYADNLELLEAAGAQLIEFSPIRDPLPAGLDGLYLGGGYPELHAGELVGNRPTRDAIREFAASGRPVYAECGGLMYLAETLELNGDSYPFCGVLPFSTRMPAPLQIAYVEIETTGGLFGADHRARGHLFHHSEIGADVPANQFYKLRTSRGDASEGGYGGDNLLASYAHVHFASDPSLAAAFVDRCNASQSSKR
jgi:cobyrinic acid a,c-diamide synthase